MHGSVLLCVHKKHTHIRLIRTGSPGRPPRTFTQLLCSSDSACGLKCFIATERHKKTKQKNTQWQHWYHYPPPPPPTHTHTHTHNHHHYHHIPPPLPPPSPQFTKETSPAIRLQISRSWFTRQRRYQGSATLKPPLPQRPPPAPAAVTDTSTQTHASPRKLKKTFVPRQLLHGGHAGISTSCLPIDG